MDPPSARRERFGHRKEGTGRIASAHRFNIGPRTGLLLDSNLKKDADGFDDVEELFGAAKHARPGAAPAGGAAESKRLTFPVAQPREARAPATAAASGGDAGVDAVTQPLLQDADFGAAGLGDDGGDGGGGGDDDDDDGVVDSRRRAAPPAKPAPRRGDGSGGGGGGAGKRTLDKAATAKMAAARKAAADERKRAAAAAAERARKASERAPPRHGGRGDDDSDDDRGGGRYSPGDGDGGGRVRPSLHTGAAEDAGEGRSKRRRWGPLNHWRGERVLYTEEGAVQAEKLGVATPAAEALGKRKRAVDDDDDDDGRKARRGGGSRSRSADGRGGAKTAPKKASRGGGGGGGRGRAASPSGDDESERDASRSRSRSAARHGGGGKKLKRGSGGGGGDRRPHESKAASRRRDDDDDDDDEDGGGRGDRGGRGGSKPSKKRAGGGAGGDDGDDDGVAATAKLRELRKEAEEAVRGTRLQEPLSPKRLPKGFQEAASPTLTVPAQAGHPMYQIAVVRHSAHLAYEKLPVTGVRPPGLVHPALAGAAFDAPQFISGTVRLRPGARKDNESTHTSTQVFVVVGCQPRALQVDIADQAYLLSPGDHFFVPQQTTYTLSNHSADADAEVAFTVIKPT